MKKLNSRIKTFRKTDLFQTTIWNGLATFIKMGTGFISNKIVAVYLGPAGVALLGQFNNFISMVASFSTFGIGSGIVKYISEYKSDEGARKSITSASFFIISLTSLVASLFVFFSRNYFAEIILHEKKYSSLFLVFSVSLAFFSLNILMYSLLNGYREFKKIIFYNIITAVLGLLISVLLVVYFNLFGALLGVIINQSLFFTLTVVFAYKSKWFSFNSFFSKFNKKDLSKLFNFSIMAFVSLFATIFIQFKIRSYIINNISIEDAGYWQGIIKISDFYIGFISSTLSIYFLPHLSAIKEEIALRREVFKSFLFLIPLVIISSIFIYIFRIFIINLLFTNKFFAMRTLFAFQIIGNVFKIATWIFTFLLCAKALTKPFIIIELFGGGLYYLLTVLFINKFGLPGATYSYSITYFILWLLLYIFYKKYSFS